MLVTAERNPFPCRYSRYESCLIKARALKNFGFRLLFSSFNFWFAVVIFDNFFSFAGVIAFGSLPFKQSSLSKAVNVANSIKY